MNNNDLVHIQLQSNKKGHSGRKIPLSRQQIIENEHNQLEPHEYFFLLDPELAEKYNGKIPSGSTPKTLLKTAKQFYKEVTKIQNENDKRKNYYLLGSLHNSDGSPVTREDNRLPDEITFIFRALLLIGLKHRTLDRKPRAYNSWLSYFGFINYQLLKDQILYYDDKKIKIKQDDNKEIFVNEINYILNKLFNYKVTKRDIAYNQEVETVLTSSELVNNFNIYISRILDLLNYQLKQSLFRLEKDKMIEVNAVKIGIEVKPFTVKNKAGIEVTKYREVGHVELSNDEWHALAELQIRLKDELNLHDYNNYQLFKNKRYRKHLKKVLQKEGLKTDATHRYFDKVYTAYSIIRMFTNKELENYLDNNIKLKEYYLLELHELIYKFRIEQDRSLDNKLSNYKKNNIKRLENEYQEMINAPKGEERRIGKPIDMKAFYTNQYEAKIFNSKLYSDYIFKMKDILLTDRHKDELEQKLIHDPQHVKKLK
ncbi:hypothetical protein [Macrococcus bovicus]|uniref:Uncharacterized protein n=1 Tax=Macrococcus bovicus TaxID=69968 RepID=A0A4R6C001_9STAP|nr:hypothetical protein [Macrococcus bovicus]TDM13782.1 hypothetical protein ERX55_07245 [Macrococcus bovicus]